MAQPAEALPLYRLQTLTSPTGGLALPERVSNSAKYAAGYSLESNGAPGHATFWLRQGSGQYLAIALSEQVRMPDGSVVQATQSEARSLTNNDFLAPNASPTFVVGRALSPAGPVGGAQWRACIWVLRRTGPSSYENFPIDLHELLFGTSPAASGLTDINDALQVVGREGSFGGFVALADVFALQVGPAKQLPVPSSLFTDTFPNRLNVNGVVVGYASGQSVGHAVQWTNTSGPTVAPGFDMGTFADFYSQAFDVTSTNHIVGQTRRTAEFGWFSAFRRDYLNTKINTIMDVLMAPVAPMTGAAAISEAGTTVGWAATTFDGFTDRAFVWYGTGGGNADLNAQIVGGMPASSLLRRATDISETGVIIGRGSIAGTTGFLLTPYVPMQLFKWNKLGALGSEPPITPDPAELDYGTQVAGGAPTSQFLVIANSEDVPLPVRYVGTANGGVWRSMAAPSADLNLAVRALNAYGLMTEGRTDYIGVTPRTLANFTLAPHTAACVQVNFAPTKVGTFMGSLMITADRTASIALKGIGALPVPVLSLGLSTDAKGRNPVPSNNVNVKRSAMNVYVFVSLDIKAKVNTVVDVTALIGGINTRLGSTTILKGKLTPKAPLGIRLAEIPPGTANPITVRATASAGVFGQAVIFVAD